MNYRRVKFDYDDETHFHGIVNVHGSKAVKGTDLIETLYQCEIIKIISRSSESYNIGWEFYLEESTIFEIVKDPEDHKNLHPEFYL